MCECHPNKTFCPNLICVDFENDVPIFVRRDSPMGIAAAAHQKQAEEKRGRAEYDRLKQKFG